VITAIVPSPSPAFLTATRISAGALLLTEAKTTRSIAAVVSGIAAHAAAELAMRESDNRIVEPGVIAAVLLFWSKRLAHELTTAIVAARLHGRQAGARRAAVELRATGGAKLLPQLREVSPLVHDPHAAVAADSLATQWRTRAWHEAQAAQRRGIANAEVDRSDVTASGAVYRTPATMSSATSRTATTETARAYSEGHVESTADLLDDEGRIVPPAGTGAVDWEGVTVLDRWSAILDSRTCGVCGALEGDHTLVGQPFVSGEEPGSVHPRCRCIRVLEFVTLQ